MAKLISAVCVVLIGAATVVALPGCKTDQEGVKTNYRSQWQTFTASVEDATDAAEAALSGLELKSVESSSTKIDGQATGLTADETKVTVSVAKVGDDQAEVSVYVGKLGDPELGKAILADIGQRLAE